MPLRASRRRHALRPGDGLDPALRAELLGFDVRKFHDAVLANGSVPLDVLDAQIDEFIAGAAARP